jgi:HAE1 family hydrophobic/amphiphilic exporter-1
MFSIPFAFVGVIWAFFITQTTLNIMSFIGLIILVGIVVKNAIVLIDYTNILRKRGLKLIEAVSLGGKHRLRPVLMTALTTMLGMLPMAMSQNEGSEMWRPLGITVIGGMLVSTLVTLVLIPVIYSIFEGRKNHVQGEQS